MEGFGLMLPIALALFFYSFGSLRVLKQYERGVAFFLGKYWGTKGPGLSFVPLGFAQMKRVSLRTVALDIPPQDVITRDNVTVKVNAVLYMSVRDPSKAIIEIEDYPYATSQLAQTTLRSVLGEVELDELLADREKINAVLKKIIDERTDPWGIEVSAVEVKDVDLPDQMKRAMARQAEAERERRAKVIAAQGELQASETLAQAAHTLAAEPSALPTVPAAEPIAEPAAPAAVPMAEAAVPRSARSVVATLRALPREAQHAELLRDREPRARPRGQPRLVPGLGRPHHRGEAQLAQRLRAVLAERCRHALPARVRHHVGPPPLRRAAELRVDGRLREAPPQEHPHSLPIRLGDQAHAEVAVAAEGREEVGEKGHRAVGRQDLAAERDVELRQVGVPEREELPLPARSSPFRAHRPRRPGLQVDG